MLNEKDCAPQRLAVYLAGPLFSDAERSFNLKLKRLLVPCFDVYLPQEDGGLLVDMIAEGAPPKVASRHVFLGDVQAIRDADLLIIILDGRSVDEGAAFELGFAYALGKPCYGLKTDPRQLLAIGNNPMIDGPLEYIFQSVDELVDWAKEVSSGSARIPVHSRSSLADELT
jgi:nucleoside 2-deoxyribosyltransferase